MSKLTDLIPDNRNANKGTARGASLLETSLRKYGAGRSILVDKNNRVIAGNKTLESAVDIGLSDAVIVETDGKKLVVVKRTDIDLDSKTGRELALADNRVGQVSLEWDAKVIAELAADVDLSQFWNEQELDELLSVVPDFQPVGIDEQGRLDQKKPIKCPHCGEEFIPNE